MNDKPRSSNFYQLTAQVLNDKNLNHAEKLTMAILNGLSSEDGTCFPSNEWLGDKLDLDERNVRKILENLENNNYIHREIISCASNPFKKYRIIHVNSNFKLFLPEDKNAPFESDENIRTVRIKTSGIIDKKELIDKSSLKRAKEKPAAPPPPESFYKEKFENKIQITPEQRSKLVEKYGGMESLIDAYAEKLYRYAVQRPSKFKEYKRHDMVIEDWIDKDFQKKETAPKQSGDLNDVQKKNWDLNLALVNELKIDCPHKCSGLHFYYKHYILKDKNNPDLDILATLDHKEFCRYLEKKLKISILNKVFPND